MIVVALAAMTGLAHRLEHALYDSASVTTAPPLQEIAIVGIDDASIASLGPWPWSRDLHAQAIDALAASGAKTIVYLPLFAQPHHDRALKNVRALQAALRSMAGEQPGVIDAQRLASEAETALDTDRSLAGSVQKAGTVVLASQYLTTGAPTPLPPYVQQPTLPDPGSHALAVQSALHPFALVGSAAAATGHVVMLPDADKRVRQTPLLLRYEDRGIPSVALLAAKASLQLQPGDIAIRQGDPTGIRLGSLEVPTDAQAVMSPRMHVRADGTSAFPVTSFASVLAGKAAPQQFKDKIVLVGETNSGLAQRLSAPNGQDVYPVEWLAHTLSSIRQGSGIVKPAWAAYAAWVFALCAVLYCALIAPRLTNTVAVAGATALALALPGVEWGLLRYQGQWISLVSAALAVAGGLAGLLGYRALAPALHVRPSPSTDTEGDRMMGLALHGQGQLDLALERLLKVAPSDALMDNLYHLAQDFERKGRFNEAKAAYKKILRYNSSFKDTVQRLQRARTLSRGQAHEPHAPNAADLRLSNKHAGAASAQLAVSTLGRYHIENELGKGAMGVVYQGRDPTIGRVVAIKTLALSHEFDGDALVEARERFFREAETAGRLQHPCIVTIFDAGEERGLAYIAMEFLQGTDLTHASNPQQLLPVATVVSIAARVALALDYAHQHNVVHRDIKPANIMYDRATDSVKVTDFGIARITDSSKTRTGLVLGTPSFMSPEQLSGKRIDGRSDLYSLGVMVFQLLAGSLPLRGDSMMDLMRKITSETPPDVRQLRPEVPAGLAEVVAFSLRKRPEDRYQTGQQFALALQRAAVSGGANPIENVSEPQSVDYDALRDATGADRADFQATVMESPDVRTAAPKPLSGA